MASSGNFTLFSSPSSSAASSSSSYLQDNFTDTTSPATNNAGLSSPILANPLSNFFANDDMPRYRAKTLFIADLLLIQDRSLWISNKPTYRIIWSEPQPHVQGYVFGDVRLKYSSQGKLALISQIGDGIAINGVIRQLAWMLNPSEDSSANAEFYTDGVDQSATASFPSSAAASSTNGVNHYNLFLHNAVKASQNIHEFRLVANTYNNLSVVGVVAYFENGTTNIDCFPGSTYIDKTKVTTTSISALALPVMTGALGAKSVVQETAAGGYQNVTVETPYVATIATGSSGTNLLNVTTGQGASFPVGLGVIGINGTSMYVGTINTQSTDTLTVFPTLSFGFSGLLYKAWSAGPTFAISASLYALSETIDPKLSNYVEDANGGFGGATIGTLYYSHPEMRYRFWGRNLNIQSIAGYIGAGFISNTLGFFQVDGEFCAAEVEFVAAGIIHGTFSINGVPAWGINEGATGILRKTIFTDMGPGRNSFVFSPGQSLINANVLRINLYNRINPVSATNGVLASYNTYINPVTRAGDVANATLMPLGGWMRLYADHLYLKGQWTRGVTYSQPGAVYYTGSSTNSLMNFQYYGTDFAILGTAGSSAVLNLDGVSIAVAVGTRVSLGTSLGWHTVQYQHKNGTSIIAGFDFLRPQQTEFKNEQKYLPRSELANIPRVFNQSDTPRNPKDFDLWASDKFNDVIWMYLFGKWNKLTISQSADDPNSPSLFIRTHGATAGTNPATGVGDVEHFNFTSWTPGTTDTNARSYLSIGEASLDGFHLVIDGVNTSAAVAALLDKYNKTSWSSGATRATAKPNGGCGVLGGLVYMGKGTTGLSETTATASVDSFDGTSWVSGVATLATSSANPSAFTQAGLVHWNDGLSSGGVGQNIHETFNGTSAGTLTVLGQTLVGDTGAASSGGNGIAVEDVATQTAKSFVWNGTSWSANISFGYAVSGQSGTFVGPCSSFNVNQGAVYTNGGSTDSATCINTTNRFNGSTWGTVAASVNSRCGCVGSSL